MNGCAGADGGWTSSDQDESTQYWGLGSAFVKPRFWHRPLTWPLTFTNSCVCRLFKICTDCQTDTKHILSGIFSSDAATGCNAPGRLAFVCVGYLSVLCVLAAVLTALMFSHANRLVQIKVHKINYYLWLHPYIIKGTDESSLISIMSILLIQVIAKIN